MCDRESFSGRCWAGGRERVASSTYEHESKTLTGCVGSGRREKKTASSVAGPAGRRTSIVGLAVGEAKRSGCIQVSEIQPSPAQPQYTRTSMSDSPTWSKQTRPGSECRATAEPQQPDQCRATATTCRRGLIQSELRVGMDETWSLVRDSHPQGRAVRLLLLPDPAAATFRLCILVDVWGTGMLRRTYHAMHARS